MLDIAMVASFIVLTLLMAGLAAWAGKAADEGADRS
jgi:hypothetical protein